MTKEQMKEMGHNFDESQGSVRSNVSILTSEQLAQKKKEILRRSNDRLKYLADVSKSYDIRY